MADTHSTSIEGLKLSILAGVDVIQHPEVLDPREIPDELVQMIKERKIIGSMLVNQITGDAWKRHLKTKETNQKKQAEAAADADGTKPKTLAGASRRRSGPSPAWARSPRSKATSSSA
jgi:hypothetical protein